MRCPYCAKTADRVIDSRETKDGATVRRRRECEECKRRFTTYERVEDSLPLVVKKDGRREPFDRAKIIAGLRRACEKRPVPASTIDRVADNIERKVIDIGEKEVESAVIGEEVMVALQKLDEVAYVRFASVYRSFRSVNDFMKELQDLLADKEKR
ncbi:MAG: transcriptional repressor NrdR [Deltaproteobacteria bacterium]|nr:transcriptional repressor NrdR [Deltaproteobacteria bacterium]